MILNRKIKWLRIFNFTFEPTSSFLSVMNLQLREEYGKVANKPFNILCINIEDPDYLVYDETTKVATLKARIEVERPFYWSDCTIRWHSTTGDRLIKPSDEVTPDEIVFEWLELNLPNIPQRPASPLTFAQRIGLEVTYELTAEQGIGSQDLELYMRLSDPAQAKPLEQQLGKLQARWNEESEGDTTHRRGFIHWVEYLGETEGQQVYRIDTGSTDIEGLKYLLAELNNPAWGVERVEIEPL